MRHHYRSPLVFVLVIKTLLLFLPNGEMLAQVDSLATPFVYIDSITIEGNRKTRPGLILRELEFSVGDTLATATLSETLERNSLRLMNLAIFNSARINVRRWENGNHIVLHISLIEAWYIFPAPIFELADRNFNVWWKEFNHSLKRVNYGFDWTQLNLTGNADILKAKVQFGYSNKYELTYRRPVINRRKTVGFDVGISYSRSHEVAYTTEGNKLQFHVNRDVWQLTQFSAGGSVLWRPGLFAMHRFSAEYRDINAADSIARYFNPNFFLDGATHQRHLSLVYNLRFDYRDIHPYPLDGWLFIADLRFNGLLPKDNLRLFRAFAEFAKYFPFWEKRLSLETVLKGRVSLPRCRPPYFNNQALGYGGNFVRGYEYYVADGLDFAMLKTAFHIQLFNRTFDLGKYMPVQAFRNFPVKIYLALNSDIGYANDPWYGEPNPLSNHLLWGYGFGLDLLVWYNKSCRLEWSWNDLGENGFFLRINTGF